MSATPAPTPTPLSGAVTGTPSRPATVDHWFDFLCPYCYLAQDRNRLLRERGVRVVEHGMSIHPEIGPGGLAVPPRSGPAYEALAREAGAVDLPLRWTDRIPHSRPALAAHEWLAGEDPGTAERFAAAVFTAYFADGRDIESADLLAGLAAEAGGDAAQLRAAWASGEAEQALARSEARAHRHGVQGTPAWVAGDRTFSGLRPREWFESWAVSLTR